MQHVSTATPARVASERTVAAWRTILSSYIGLMKPHVTVLLLGTTLAAMAIAGTGLPPFSVVLATMVGGALAAGSANAINCWYDRDIDKLMSRTKSRTLPAGRVSDTHALIFGIVIGVLSFLVLGFGANWLAAALAASAILFYVFIYTMWLKRTTTQNIVIGGAAGAVPVLVGWAAATGRVDWAAFWMFAIIFMWTPPHFWALALFVKSDYANAGVPMLPVVRGQAVTRRQILAYAILLFPVSLAPWWVGGTGAIYGVCALVLSALFVAFSLPVALRRSAEGDPMKPEKRLFAYSVLYLFAVFTALVADRLILGQGLAA